MSVFLHNLRAQESATNINPVASRRYGGQDIGKLRPNGNPDAGMAIDLFLPQKLNTAAFAGQCEILFDDGLTEFR